MAHSAHHFVSFAISTLHDALIFVALPLLSVLLLLEIEESGWKQSNPGCAEKHITAAAVTDY